MSLVNEQYLFLQDVAKLIQFAASKGIVITGGELYRTAEQQQIYIDKGLSRTAASKHLKRLAVDLNIIANGQLGDIEAHRPSGEYWQSLGSKNTWGGTWGWDANHYERNA